MLLQNDREAFNELIETVAEEIGLQPFQVEKDYFVSLFLKNLNAQDKNKSIVFKGGTSLSKCYNVIDRFSEDIDLAMFTEDLPISSTKRKSLNRLISNTISQSNMYLRNDDEIMDTNDYVFYEVKYDRQMQYEFGSEPDILIETIVAYKPYPCVKLPVSNYITKYLEKNNYNELIDKYELQPFEMQIQSIERTFIDKLFALCDYHIAKEYNRNSRHIYDIHKIWSSNQIDMELVNEIINDVIIDRQKYGKKNYSCMPGQNPNETLMKLINEDVYLDDYNNVTVKLIYNPVEYDSCMESMKEIQKLCVLPDNVIQY